MRVAAFIPARGGSKRVERKNLQEVPAVGTVNQRRTLLHRAMDAARDGGCSSITVSTDDAETAMRVGNTWPWTPDRAYELSVHHRPAPLASDHAQIETAIAHWWTRLDTKPDAVVLLQPTSPFRSAAHVRDAIRLLWGTGADCVVGVTMSHAPHFAGRCKPREGEEGGPAMYYDWQPFASVYEPRPRTQDMRPMGHENGSLYAFTREWWEKSGQRMGGRMTALPMTWIEGLDVDTPEDLCAARAIAEGMGL